jgi:hypothetical protein
VSSDLEEDTAQATQEKWWQCGHKNNSETSKELKEIFIVQLVTS